MSEIRRKLMIGKEESIFESAYFYVPFYEKQTVNDINNGITPTINTGHITGNGYYTNGINEILEYKGDNLFNITNDVTLYIEFIPYELTKSQFLFDLTYRFDTNCPHLLSLYIYKTKNNKYGMTLNRRDADIYMDSEISNSQVVVYGKPYRVCIKYNRSQGNLAIFINGVKFQYTNYYSILYPNSLRIGGHAVRTDLYAKAEYKTLAIWNVELTDEECFNLTI